MRVCNMWNEYCLVYLLSNGSYVNWLLRWGENFFFFIYLIFLFPNMFERYGLKQNKYERSGGSDGRD